MPRDLKKIALVLSLVVLGFSTSIPVYAQGLDTNTDTQIEDDTGLGTGVGGTTDTLTDDGVNWLWLVIPLVAVVTYLLLRRDDRQADTYERQDEMAGVKGGRTTYRSGTRKRETDI